MINTKRLNAQEVVIEDSLGLLKCFNNPNVIKYLTLPQLKKETEIINFIKINYLSYKRRCEYPSLAIHYKDTKECIGVMEIHNENEYKGAEIGIYIQEEYWNKGIGQEAIEALVNYGFSILGLHRLEMLIVEDNLGCKALVKNCGFKYEGTLSDYILLNNRYNNVEVYSIINKEK
ncbi:MAG: GNAT family protein [Erysipelotrichaceae bacterium]